MKLMMKIFLKNIKKMNNGEPKRAVKRQSYKIQKDPPPREPAEFLVYRVPKIFENTYLQLFVIIMIMITLILKCSEMKIIIFLNLQKIMSNFIHPKFFQIGNVNDLEYITYIQLYLTNNNKEKSVIIKYIDRDTN
jgi:hypothetical protein